MKEVDPDGPSFFSQMKAQIRRCWDDTSRRKGTWGWQGQTYLVYRKLWNSQILNGSLFNVTTGNQRASAYLKTGKWRIRPFPRHQGVQVTQAAEWEGGGIIKGLQQKFKRQIVPYNERQGQKVVLSVSKPTERHYTGSP